MCFVNVNIQPCVSVSIYVCVFLWNCVSNLLLPVSDLFSSKRMSVLWWSYSMTFKIGNSKSVERVKRSILTLTWPRWRGRWWRVGLNSTPPWPGVASSIAPSPSTTYCPRTSAWKTSSAQICLYSHGLIRSKWGKSHFYLFLFSLFSLANMMLINSQNVGYYTCSQKYTSFLSCMIYF